MIPPRRAARAARFALLVVLGLAGCHGSSQKLDEANELRHGGKPREALHAYQEVLATLGEGRVSAGDDDVRRRALRYAGDVAYLELGDYLGAISYYRRLVSLYPGTEEAYAARARIGDIYRERLQDHVAAIAQYADIAASDAKDAARYQLEVAREYLALRNTQQARTEARILRERWPNSALADEAQLLTAQAWALDKRSDEALGAFQATIDRKPRPEISALAFEGMAHIYSQEPERLKGRALDKALELYALALPAHPNPDAVRTDIEKVRQRREAARTVRPGDRDAVFDRKLKDDVKEIP